MDGLEPSTLYARAGGIRLEQRQFVPAAWGQKSPANEQFSLDAILCQL
jgi:hypothetical protein